MNQDITEIFMKLFEYLTSNGWKDSKIYQLLTGFMKGKYYPQNEVLFEKSETIDQTFFVSSGFFTLLVYNARGDRQITEIAKAGEIIAIPSFIKQSPSVHDLYVIEGSYAIYLSHSEIEEVYRALRT